MTPCRLLKFELAGPPGASWNAGSLIFKIFEPLRYFFHGTNTYQCVNCYCSISNHANGTCSYVFIFLKTYDMNAISDSIGAFKHEASKCDPEKLNHAIARVGKRISKAQSSVRKATALKTFADAIIDVESKYGTCGVAIQNAHATFSHLETKFAPGQNLITQARDAQARYNTAIRGVIARGAHTVHIEHVAAAESRERTAELHARLYALTHSSSAKPGRR